MWVKPAPGRTVRRPDTYEHLRPEGEDVPFPGVDLFWARRLADGDVLLEAAQHPAQHPAEQKGA